VTVAHLDLPYHPEPHGFRPVLTARGRAAIARGKDKDHGRRLAAYQQAVHLAALDWIEAHDGAWPHYDDPIFLGAVFWLRRPTTYRNAEMWHRTRRGGPRSKGGGTGGDKTNHLRAVEDALTGAFYRDDGQVTDGRAAKPLVDRNQPEHVELWVTSEAHADEALALMAARLPNRQGQPGPLGQTRNDADVLPVISEACSPGARSIPGLSSPPTKILFPSVQCPSPLLRGR
jgi:hypothetical protein